jgi:hypothetical protein
MIDDGCWIWMMGRGEVYGCLFLYKIDDFEILLIV